VQYPPRVCACAPTEPVLLLLLLCRSCPVQCVPQACSSAAPDAVGCPAWVCCGPDTPHAGGGSQQEAGNIRQVSSRYCGFGCPCCCCCYCWCCCCHLRVGMPAEGVEWEAGHIRQENERDRNCGLAAAAAAAAAAIAARVCVVTTLHDISVSGPPVSACVLTAAVLELYVFAAAAAGCLPLLTPPCWLPLPKC
jgi:hypothetical protein